MSAPKTSAVLVLEPAPGLGLRRARRFADDDVEARQFRLDLGPGQEMQTAHQHRALDHRRLRAVETLEGRVRGVMCNAAHEPGAQGILPHLDDNKFEMRQGRRQARRGDNRRGGQGPIATAGETSGEDAHVVGQVRDGVGGMAQVLQRRRRVKRRQNPAVAFGDQTQRRKMRLPAHVDGGHYGFADQRHGLSLRFA